MTAYNPLPAHLEAAQYQGGISEQQTPSYGGTVNTGSEWEWVVDREGRRSRTPSRSPHRSAPEPHIHRSSSLSQSVDASSMAHHLNGSVPPTSAPPHLSIHPHEPTITEEGGASHPHSTRSYDTSSHGTSSQAPSHRDASRRKGVGRVVGDWQLGKTLGAGSMGKVKIATHVVSREKCAVKIVPRYGDHSRREEPRTADDAERQRVRDESKEIRTIREAAISLLLHHPYICGMRELITHTNNHYMVFEYIDGGQMLDYIIANGRLRERAARKFARQIASALDYCHRNSIVHRDLKIENILISKNGNIKIIDFGLSNLYAPDRQLKTFCGSLYFAAPELLNARPYTGPEVDLWSFGIVLYVLACGKVPFDDQSMPALHAKIKRGIVEYPSYLSLELKHILQRMLVVNPAERAVLDEIIHHPWMNRGYENGPLDSHLIIREPLRADDLDLEVINSMGGFTFGTPEEIQEDLRDVLASEAYHSCLTAWEARRERRKLGPSGVNGAASSSSMALSTESESPKKKRFSGFDLKKKLFKETEKKPEEPVVPAREKEPLDPTRGFHPLISIYYLAREKMERERVYGNGHFATSLISVDALAEESSLSGSGNGIGYGGSIAPPSPSRGGFQAGGTGGAITGRMGGYDMAVPSLPVPPSSFSPGYDDPVPRDYAFQPRSRADDVPNPIMQHPSADAEQSNIADIPTAHQRRQPSITQPPMPGSPLQPSPMDREDGAFPSSAKRFGLLSRNDRPPSAPSRSSSAANGLQAGASPSIPPSPSLPPPVASGSASASGSHHRRAATVQDKKHERRVSVGSLTNSMGRASLSRRASQRQVASPNSPPDNWPSPREADENGHRSAGATPAASGSQTVNGSAGPSTVATRDYSAHNDSKNIFLRGLFSASTTSSKSYGEILANIEGCAERIGIKYRPIRSGLECLHLPSIDLASVINNSDDDVGGPGLLPNNPPIASTPSKRKSIRRKNSRQNVNGGLGLTSPPPTTTTTAVSARTNGTGANGTGIGAGADSRTPTQLVHSSSGTVSAGFGGDKDAGPSEAGPSTPGPSGALRGQGGSGGEEDPDSDAEIWAKAERIGANLCVRFEVTIVKLSHLPFFPLNGIMFTRISGDGWQYQQLVKTLLKEMKLPQIDQINEPTA